MYSGKPPYKLVVGNDGAMRVLNLLDTLILNTKDNPDKSCKKYENYLLEVLNARTFRIVDAKSTEVWNMWNNIPYHKLNIYLKENLFFMSLRNKISKSNINK